MEELKPYPFCNGKADVRIFSQIANVGCRKCDIRTRYEHFDDLSVAIDAWNTRAIEAESIEDLMKQAEDALSVMEPFIETLPWHGLVSNEPPMRSVIRALPMLMQGVCNSSDRMTELGTDVKA